MCTPTSILNCIFKCLLPNDKYLSMIPRLRMPSTNQNISTHVSKILRRLKKGFLLACYTKINRLLMAWKFAHKNKNKNKRFCKILLQFSRLNGLTIFVEKRRRSLFQNIFKFWQLSNLCLGRDDGSGLVINTIGICRRVPMFESHKRILKSFIDKAIVVVD